MDMFRIREDGQSTYITIGRGRFCCLKLDWAGLILVDQQFLQCTGILQKIMDQFILLHTAVHRNKEEPTLAAILYFMDAYLDVRRRKKSPCFMGWQTFRGGSVGRANFFFPGG